MDLEREAEEEEEEEQRGAEEGEEERRGEGGGRGEKAGGKGKGGKQTEKQTEKQTAPEMLWNLVHYVVQELQTIGKSLHPADPYLPLREGGKQGEVEEGDVVYAVGEYVFERVWR